METSSRRKKEKVETKRKQKHAADAGESRNKSYEHGTTKDRRLDS